MVSPSTVHDQLKRLGVRLTGLAKHEIKELPKILIPGETLTQVTMGWYDGGLALLCCTDQRLLLVDKKMLFLNLEDIRYDMIAEVMYQYRLMDASIIITAGKKLHFRSWNQSKLRQLSAYVQQRVMEVRQYDQHHMPLANMLDSGPVTPVLSIPAAITPAPKALTPVLEAPASLSSIPNPYQVRPQFRRRKVWRFITSSQLGPR